MQGCVKLWKRKSLPKNQRERHRDPIIDSMQNVL
jgi:hypothetical protein